MKIQIPVRRSGRVAQWAFLVTLTLAAFASGHAAAVTKDRIYIGTYTNHGSQGIYVCDFDPASGSLTSPGLAPRPRIRPF